jgi:hypothetical protein
MITNSGNCTCRREHGSDSERAPLQPEGPGDRPDRVRGRSASTVENFRRERRAGAYEGGQTLIETQAGGDSARLGPGTVTGSSWWIAASHAQGSLGSGKVTAGWPRFRVQSSFFHYKSLHSPAADPLRVRGWSRHGPSGPAAANAQRAVCGAWRGDGMGGRETGGVRGAVVAELRRAFRT